MAMSFPSRRNSSRKIAPLTRRTDFLHRPPFGWRLTLLPLIVIPWAVYLASPVVQPQTDLHTASVVAGGAPIPNPVQGIDGKGRHYLIERSPEWPMIEFRMRLKQPNTIVDRTARGGM